MGLLAEIRLFKARAALIFFFSVIHFFFRSSISMPKTFLQLRHPLPCEAFDCRSSTRPQEYSVSCSFRAPPSCACLFDGFLIPFLDLVTRLGPFSLPLQTQTNNRSGRDFPIAKFFIFPSLERRDPSPSVATSAFRDFSFFM